MRKDEAFRTFYQSLAHDLEGKIPSSILLQLAHKLAKYAVTGVLHPAPKKIQSKPNYYTRDVFLTFQNHLWEVCSRERFYDEEDIALLQLAQQQKLKKIKNRIGYYGS